MRIGLILRTTALCLALALSIGMAVGMYLIIEKYRVEPQLPSDDTVPDTTGSSISRPPYFDPGNSGAQNPDDPAGTQRELTAHHAFVYDMASGELTMLRGHSRDRLFPASITKLFSTYVILLHLSLEQQITAGDALDLVAFDASIADIRKGNILTVQMLIEGMLIPSGNDAACILAVEVGRKLGGSDLSAQGAMDVFVTEMNHQAQLHGLTGTRFSNADGYHEELHYTSTEDLVKISRLVLTHPLLSELVKLDTKTVTFVSGETKVWRASNFFLNSATKYYDPTCIGLKTGRTTAAGNCLLAAFQVKGRVLIIGVFGCPEMDDRFLDTQQILKQFS